MFNISYLLKKISNKLEEGNLNLENIIFILNKHTNLVFNKKDLDIKNSELFIKTTSVKKNIIFIKKNNILMDLKVYNIKNIR